jgi:hypothetical protein
MRNSHQSVLKATLRGFEIESELEQRCFMACLCEQVAGTGIELSPTCIGHLWIFQNLEVIQKCPRPFRS